MGKISNFFRNWAKHFHSENPEADGVRGQDSRIGTDTFESWSGDNSPCEDDDSFLAVVAVPGIMGICERDEIMDILGLGDDDTTTTAKKVKKPDDTAKIRPRTKGL